MVYVVFADGETLTTIGLALPLNDVPSESVPLHEPEPVTAMLKLVALPLHIVAVPVIAPVGRVVIDKCKVSVEAQPLPLV